MKDVLKFAIATAVLMIITLAVSKCTICSSEVHATAPTETRIEAPKVEYIHVPAGTAADDSVADTVDDSADAESEAWYMSLGEYRLTAYCACEKCCGAYGKNRPLDKDGKPIVYTASGAIAEQGVTIAADTDLLPFGTVVKIADHEYVVQDRGGGIKGRCIDIYFESHEQALEFGVGYLEVLLRCE